MAVTFTPGVDKVTAELTPGVFALSAVEVLLSEVVLPELAVGDGVGVGEAAIWMVIVWGISWLPVLSVEVNWMVVSPGEETMIGSA